MKALFLIILFLVIAIFTKAQEKTPALTKITEVFNKGITESAIDKVFIKTDKDIYCPGEKIWFKAEIFNCLTETLSDEKELVVMLKGRKGEIITDQKYLVINGCCDNKLTIPSWATEGNVYLVAYTPKSLKGNDVSLSAVKPICINSLGRNDYLFNYVLNKNVFKPGEEAKLFIQPTSVTPAIKHGKMLVTLYDYNQKISSERITVTLNAISEIKFNLPEKIINGLFFEINFPEGSNFSQNIPVYTTADNISVEFYPEGGTLLTNNIQRILYRATDPFGEPIDISGNVYDQYSNQVGIGKIIKKGYGLINLMPMPNQKYYFKIKNEYGKDKEFELPEAMTDGSCFSLVKTEDSTLRVSVMTIGKYSGDKLTLSAISMGKICFTSEIDGSIKNNLNIPTAVLPYGIINFIICSPEGEILSERLVYNTPYQDINIDIIINMKPSLKNGEVEICIDLNKFIDRFGKSKIDVCIADKFNLYNPDETEIQSFLKYPLQTPVPKTVLDIYLTNFELIANEYKYYNLKDILVGIENKKPKSVISFSGYVTDNNGKSVPNTTVMALKPNNLSLATTTTDVKGRFFFSGISKSEEIIVKAFSQNGEKSYTVHLFRTFDESLEEIILLESFSKKPAFDQQELIAYYQQNKELLKIIETENKENKAHKMPNSKTLLKSGISVLEVVKMTKPFMLQGNQLFFYGSKNSLNFQSGAIIVIDGQNMGTDVSVLNSLSSFDIKSISISTDPVNIQRFSGINSMGVIEIKTKLRTDDILLPKDKSEYNVTESSDPEIFPFNVSQYQTTLLWKNNIPIDESGKVNLKLPLSEIKTDFVIRVNATSEEGIKHQETSIFSTKR